MDLQFGTAGLRGIIGAGTNRMNIYVVRKTTQGLANYIIKQNGRDKGVAIAYDSAYVTGIRKEAALTLAANGIKAYYFESLRPTPELSYAVRHLGCIAGINVWPATIRRNTMAIRSIGKTAPRSRRRTTAVSWMK